MNEATEPQPSISPPSTSSSPAKRQKRASLLTLSLMGVAPIVIYSWDPLHKEMALFESADACVNGSSLSRSACEALQAEAHDRSEQLAPSYTHLEACEADFARVSGQCERGEWCSAEAITACQVGADHHARPAPSGFMASATLLKRLQDGDVDADAIAEDDLQPIYGMSEQSLNGGSGYYGYFGSWHYFTNQGHHLGRNGTREQRLHRHFLSASAGPHTTQGFSPGTLPSRFTASGSGASRGGFGGTARQSMMRATG
ncbi:DUF1190 domain-containing protein [Halomonas heilongjiangensis]|uniref:DUF1190 domain-containing protein n=1 Tax=Halomonas heilongjiangensis TaxID=1387883 RepID=A0A2N7TNZ8_9GAMM|nr:DUF1190 domain-containing protein [Halomonas heilongjiangensis]PMR69931.1 hypothetical protein C1H66_08715 [Halomonas heilongjiangensis]PXX94090.1 hypothetical protein CR158_01905 [Halomonas heilongjiangensis]